MAQLWTTGPAHIYAGAPGASPGSAFYVGTCEDKPDVEIDDRWLDVHNDLGGKVAFDKSYQGQVGMFVGDLNRFNYPVLQALCTVPNTAAALAGVAIGGAVPVPGLNLPGDIGTLALSEGQNYQLFILFPYFSTKPAMIALDQAGRAVAGYLFPGAITNKETITGMGTSNHKKRLIVDLMRTVNMGVTNTFGAGAFALYTTSFTGLPFPN